MEAMQKNKTPGAFVPLPASQLKHELFQNQRLDELNLPSFSAEDLTERNLGNALAFPLPENDAIRVFGMPRNVLLDFRILSKAASVVRDVTIKLVDQLQAAGQESSQRNRFVLAGPTGCGKSFLLIQGVEYAASAGWIVMYIPRAINLVNSSTAYSYDLRTQTYLQPIFAQQTLERFRFVNEHALNSLVAEDKIELGGSSLPQGTPLLKLIDVGLKDRASAPAVLSALLEALGNRQEYLYCLPLMTSKRFSRELHTRPHISRRFVRGTYPCLASFSNMRAVENHLRAGPSLEPCPSQTRPMGSRKNSVTPWACSHGYDHHHISKLRLKSQPSQKAFSL